MLLIASWFELQEDFLPLTISILFVFLNGSQATKEQIWSYHFCNYFSIHSLVLFLVYVELVPSENPLLLQERLTVRKKILNTGLLSLLFGD
jgi:hypothetical protein